jgi:hypothetical protein
MRKTAFAYAIAILSSTVCLLDGASRTTGERALFLFGLESVTAVLAAVLIAALTMSGVGRRTAWASGLRAAIIGLALGPVGGMILAILAMASLRASAPASIRFWDGMVDVAPRFGLAGALGAATYWLVCGTRGAVRGAGDA